MYGKKKQIFTIKKTSFSGIISGKMFYRKKLGFRNKKEKNQSIGNSIYFFLNLRISENSAHNPY